jgi:acyl-CoA thioesterase FadM
LHIALQHKLQFLAMGSGGDAVAFGHVTNAAYLQRYATRLNQFLRNRQLKPAIGAG